ncbi:MAG TPA: hypothetical protein VMR16_01155 [Candidatus Saccharimonadales bacterium]|nr:hypothetical protein [Candidatus Saccharimonadales bacterium]
MNRIFDEGVDSAVIVNQLTNNIREHIPEKPQLLPLLDALIDVAKSPQPQLKLLSVLGLASLPKQSPKSAALLASSHEFSASIKELKEKATEDKPSDKNDHAANTVPPETPTELKSEMTPRSSSDIKQSTVSEENTTSKDQTHMKSKKTNDPVEPGKTKKLDWAKLVDYTRKNHIALYCVLSNCGYELSENNLTIYTNNKFHKKKLDDPKYSSLLAECLQATGVYGLDIHTIPTSLPPKDSQAAAVAAIMGGGEEVSIEST